MDKSEKILVAVSGGADSMFLLHHLLSQGYTNLIVGHFNHHWSGFGTKCERFVCDEVDDLGLKWFVGDGTPCAFNETEARAQRWEYLTALASAQGCRTIATGHNATDRVETMLANLQRGCGLAGLTAMEEFGWMRWRPLTHLSREEIRCRCLEQNIGYIEDPTNSQPVCARNELRPLLEHLNVGAISKSLTLIENQNEAIDEASDWLLDDVVCKNIDFVWELPTLDFAVIDVNSDWQLWGDGLRMNIIRQAILRVRFGKEELTDITEEDLQRFLAVTEKDEAAQRRKGLLVFQAKKGNNKFLVISRDFKCDEFSPFESDGFVIRPWKKGDKLRDTKVARILKAMQIPRVLREGWQVWEKDGVVVGVQGWQKNTEDLP